MTVEEMERWDPDNFPGNWERGQQVGEDLAWFWSQVAQAALCKLIERDTRELIHQRDRIERLYKRLNGLED